ncbi:hypothetical protein [Pleomorphovibrio marinus]|uniref:hypothetical protein n=1 Tax=Pleomorphovibrio marinus TaxID=2164132 RepID=UPI000E0A870D|nr:hypothetical protein [Pleomorphovibrio marinus]
MFDQFYQQSSEQLKLAFLQKVFQKYPDLKEDFLDFYLKPPAKNLKMTVSDPDDFISASTDLVKEDLESININEPDWQDYIPRHNGYIPEYEAMEHMAEDEVNRIIGFHVAEVERYCTEKHGDLAFLYMISLYQACTEAVLEDEYETLPDPTRTMLDQLEQHLQDCSSLFSVIQLSEDQLFTIASVLFDRNQKFHSDDPGFLTFFEAFLFSVIHSGAEANILLDVIEKKNATDAVPWLVSELHRKTGGLLAWEQSALQFFKKNKHVASSLLEQYKNDNKQEFVRIANALWSDGLFQEEFANLYFEVLEPSDDPELYQQVTIRLNERKFSESYYRVLQELMDKEERMRYIERFHWDKPSYVLALCMEGNHVEAINYARQHTDRWNIIDIMTPCIQANPKAGLDLLDQKIAELLVDERGRNFYERIARILKVAADITELQKDAEVLAKKIYSVYSRLTALRAELRSAGLIRL